MKEQLLKIILALTFVFFLFYSVFNDPGPDEYWVEQEKKRFLYREMKNMFKLMKKINKTCKKINRDTISTAFVSYGTSIPCSKQDEVLVNYYISDFSRIKNLGDIWVSINSENITLHNSFSNPEGRPSYILTVKRSANK